LGYLSTDGWLQVTGRTKEVIKRGGETLAPMEVEEIVMRHLRHEFQEVAAFGIKDVEMGENVALAIVTRPNQPRIGLPRIHSALHGVLRPQLWPQALIYCETNLPKTSTGKVQRAKLSKACNSIVVSQRMSWRERVFHAVLNQKHSREGLPFQILRPVETSRELMADDLSSAAELALRPLFLQTVTRLLSDGKTSVLYALGEAGREQVHELLAELDDFDKPDAVVQIRATEFPEVFPAPKALDFLIDKDYEPPSSEEEKTICKVWANILGCDEAIISVSTDFFEAGGTSLQAGRVASELRTYFHRNVPIHWIFANPRLKDLSKVIKESSELEDFWPQESNNSRLSPQVTTDDSSVPFLMDERVDICSRREDMGPSSLNPLVLMIQFVVPLINVVLQQLCVLVSFFMGLRWSALYMVDLQLEERQLVSAMTVLHLNYFAALGLVWTVSNCCLPFVGILIKWTVVGRLQPGKYPLWGLQYVNWWIAKHALESFGIGVFAFTQPLRRLYLRMLGASISSSANLSPLGAEVYVAADLLDLREGVMVDGARLKCTALDARTGHIAFTPLLLEKGVSVGYRSIVAPGSRIEPETCIGPLSTSHELQDADDRWRKFNSFTFPEPHILLRVCLGYPLKSLCSLITILPWILLLQYVTAGILWRTEKIHWLTLGIEELSQPHRIIAWILAFALARTGLNSVIYVTLVIFLKWLVIGRFRPGPWRESQWAVFQHWFMALLLDSGYIEQFAALVGPHYYLMTVYYKLMGSTVGKRIFWPGKPLEIIEYDLLEVGDDVTFGSRTAIRCSDAAGMQKVRILTGAMVADNCIILPGTVVGENVVLGTGSLGNGVYQSGTLCIGNQRGGAVILRGHVHKVEDYFSQDASSETCTPASRLDSPNESEEGSNASVASSSRPFGRVFYADDCGCGTCWSSNIAPYAILGWPGILFINIVVRLIWAPVECSHRWLVLILLNLCLPQMRLYHLSNWSILIIILGLTLAVQLTKLFLKVFTDISLKWILLGKREPGIFTWDTSSYCQRWKIYTSIRHVLESEMSQFGGSFWIILYYRLLGASIGSNVCLYPWGASPMMTEPDLVTIGDGACIEAAHLVAHTNVHGEFRLEEVKIGDFCTLRDNSRVVSGAEMLEGSTLLEHSLVMPGEVMPADTCWQGWPNRWQGTSKQNPRMESA
jgi:acetyltransferase-like isoleucine patch superfamily enzyme